MRHMVSRARQMAYWTHPHGMHEACCKRRMGRCRQATLLRAAHMRLTPLPARPPACLPAAFGHTAMASLFRRVGNLLTCTLGFKEWKALADRIKFDLDRCVFCMLRWLPACMHVCFAGEGVLSFRK